MASDARLRINAHRLVRNKENAPHEARVDSARTETNARVSGMRRRATHRIVLHVALFAVAFIFTTGAAVLSILLWVSPDTLLPLVLVGLFSGAVYVGAFASLRILILQYVLQEPTTHDDGTEDPHVSKSIAYGMVALVFAVLLAGLLINIASAFTF